MATSRKLLANGVVTVPAASVKKLTDGTGANLALLDGVNRLTVRNIGLNRIEILFGLSGAPTSGAMDFIDPKESVVFEYEKAVLDLLYAKAETADTKVVVYQEGP